MIVTIAGHERTWKRESRMISECIACGSSRFRQSKLTKCWHCKECNEPYPDGKPLFSAITCSAHGKQVLHDEHAHWCWECDEEDWNATSATGRPAP
ncbi:MAG: hypothetical protein JO197_15580 [Acidobacteria bacterium]|nr:hypothetical protein [Acidobacteriota bacterium]MBV9475056.1 hypothetical protein [Acidobacteriota bacterium]